MDCEKLFNDLESNQTQDCEEAKKKLIDMLMQTREHWLVHGMMDYFLRTGSLRIIEVLVKVQSPHDNYIFDRLCEWLKGPVNRIQALNLFGFIVRKHPTWLFKVEKHKLIKEILKLLQTEKEIVSLMSALLCIITLLPIIPNLVPNFLGDLFDIFGHLASWNCQNPNRLSEDKLVHLQLGLQMLFHRLYGMYPCNFLAFISEFIKKEKAAIFHHTIKPLLESVRVHPSLVTATIETELSSSRWKDMEPHDVVVECAKLSLPVTYQDFNVENSTNFLIHLQDTPVSENLDPIKNRRKGLRRTLPTFDNDIASPFQPLRENEQFAHFRRTNSIWSPSTEVSMSSGMPLTPTPSFGFPLSNSVTAPNVGQVLGVTGSSPPEAAEEATPETTPLKDTNLKPSTNSHAVRAIFVPSQPSSPMRKEPNQFNFPDLPPSNMQQTSIVEQQTRVTKITTTIHDAKICQKMLNDIIPPHISQISSFNETQKDHHQRNLFGHSIDLISRETYDDCVSANFQDCCNTTTSKIDCATEHIPKYCDDCDETERTMCTSGGLHIPNSRSMQILAKGIKRSHLNSVNYFNSPGTNTPPILQKIKFRRTKSCSAIATFSEDKHCKDFVKKIKCNLIREERKKPCSLTSRLTQTIQTWPQNYEYNLFEMFFDSNQVKNSYEKNLVYPQDILNQYVDRTLKPKSNADSSSTISIDQEHFQLLRLQLQYERYRREIHAERNRRLMGRSRDKRSLEMERDRLRDQLKGYSIQNKELMHQVDRATKLAKERQQKYAEEINAITTKYHLELERTKVLRLANETLQARLNEEMIIRRDINYELESLRGQIFDMRTEFQHAQIQAELGMQCKQELAHLEAEFIIMGEVQIKCRDRLAEIDNFRARDEELLQIQETANLEIKDLKQALEEKSYQLDNAKHKLFELQCQLANNEKVFTEQKRLLKTVKDEYEEKFKALNKKYAIQKTIIIQMEEKLISLQRNSTPIMANISSHDVNKTNIASEIDRKLPFLTSVVSSDTLSGSLRLTELRNLQNFVEPVGTVNTISNATPDSLCISGANNSFNSGESKRPISLDSNSSLTAGSSLKNSVIPSVNHQFKATATICDKGSALMTNPTHSLDMPLPSSSSSNTSHQYYNTRQTQQQSKQKQQPAVSRNQQRR